MLILIENYGDDSSDNDDDADNENIKNKFNKNNDKYNEANNDSQNFTSTWNFRMWLYVEIRYYLQMGLGKVLKIKSYSIYRVILKSSDWCLY